MKKKSSAIDKIQELMDRKKTGILLYIKLLNKHEINVLVDDYNSVTQKFSDIIKQSCANFNNYTIVQTDDSTKVYIVLQNNLKNVKKLTNLIHSQLGIYIDKEFPETYLRCSIGSIKFSPELFLTADKLISRLVYSILSSNNQSGYHAYEDNFVDINKLKANNVQLNLLRSALIHNDAKFSYQPIIDRKTGDIEYYECLLRIRDENNKWISAGPIIQDAEQKGLINLVDFTVIEMAIKELNVEKDINLSVNISNIGVVNKRLLNQIERLLTQHDVSNRLIIEITETSLNLDFESTKHFIDVLHEYGCRFALDDFGSGFTSFKQLTKLPIDIVKIDGSYIRDILSNKYSKSFVELLINLLSELNIKTVAEFVENGEIARFLIDLKIDAMQGNFFLPASRMRI